MSIASMQACGDREDPRRMFLRLDLAGFFYLVAAEG